ncbi:MAG: Gfo/Idh/MocA family protein [Candidatus Geothermarchaeales archaeon]
MASKSTGVVGCGWFGGAHCRIYDEISNLVAVCDVDGERAKKQGERYGVNWYVDHKKMLGSESLDAVSIVVPPSQIPIVGYDFARAGVGVLLEKPLGVRVEDLRRLSEFSGSVRIMPGFIEIFNPVVERLRESLDRIGSPVMAAARRIGRFPRRFWKIGVVLDLAFHDIYIFRHLFGDVDQMRSMLSYYYDEEFEDAAVLLLELKSGVKGVIEANWLTPSKERKMRIYGSEGVIEIDFIGQDLRVFKDVMIGSTLTAKEDVVHPQALREPLERELKAFLYSEKPPLTLEDGIEVLRLALEASKKNQD